MPLDFPTTPSVGDEFTGTFGEIYTWDGDKWTLTEPTGEGGVNPDSLISTDPNNILELGTDSKLFVPPPPAAPQVIVPLPMYLASLAEGATSPNLGMWPNAATIINAYQISAQMQVSSPGTATFTLLGIPDNGGGTPVIIGTGATNIGNIYWNFSDWYGGGYLGIAPVFRLQNTSDFGGNSNMSNIMLTLYFIAETQNP